MTVSTLSMNKMTLTTLQTLKRQAGDAMLEYSTGRHVDVGLSLGRLTGTSVSYRVQDTSFDAQLQTNKVIANKLDQAYDIMGAVSNAADSISSSLLSAEKYQQYPQLATSALEQLQGSLNTSVGGTYVFGGMKADTPPIKDVQGGIEAAKTKFQDFLTALGKTASQVTDTEMKGFLSDAGYAVPAGTLTPAGTPAPGAGQTFRFLDTVNDANWTTNWSNASSAETFAGVSKSQTVQTSVSANQDAFRKVTAAYSMLAAIGGEDLSEAAKKALTRSAAEILEVGKPGITALRAAVGDRQNVVTAANTAVTSQQDIVQKAFNDLEGVDQTEAGTRYQNLETQLQAAYTITGRLQKLSILDYL
ncbi:flagellin [Aureimonas endophytica]|uniref:Flagellin n=1 Tax=Aureimonas endophytica TaxID=2027858 RepID=A0A917A0B7_9HYPH|nr:flagellar hook-associated family protein [Aureimonas endophytica]GGE19802.1 flagellin [Aureimonas endophytica]